MDFFTVLKDNLPKFAVLKLYVHPQHNELTELYKEHIKKHNSSIITDPFPNSGFDLFVPEDVVIDGMTAQMVSMNVKCELIDDNGDTSPFFMFPRSSISKTPLMLANHTGIIDSGYRGFLIGAFRNLNLNSSYTIDKHTRLLQICHPSLCPIHVIMVEDTDLSVTKRGTGGFGSTGK